MESKRSRSTLRFKGGKKMAVKVAINGLGRIGRAALKLILDTPELELVAVNDIGSLENMAYLIKYDTVYGRYERDVEAADGALVVDGKPISYLSERDPARLPWSDLGVELVFECTRLFTKQEDANKHIEAGASWVILSGPTSSVDVPTVVHGVNRPGGDTSILSCASCTTTSASRRRSSPRSTPTQPPRRSWTAPAARKTSAAGGLPPRTSFRPAPEQRSPRPRRCRRCEEASMVSRCVAPSRSVRSRTSSSCSVGRRPRRRSTPPCARKPLPRVTGRSSELPKIRSSPATSWGIRGRRWFSST